MHLVDVKVPATTSRPAEVDLVVVGAGFSGFYRLHKLRQLGVSSRVLEAVDDVGGNGPVKSERRAPLDADRKAYRQIAKWSRAGEPSEPTQVFGRYSTPELQRERFEAAWATSELIPILGVFAEQILFADANQIVAERLREKIRVVVYATGFDAMTGAIVAVDITGRDGLTLKQQWAHGPINDLGLMTVGFPNFFTFTEPGSPSVLANRRVSIKQHVDWVSAALSHLRAEGMSTR